MIKTAITHTAHSYQLTNSSTECCSVVVVLMFVCSTHYITLLLYYSIRPIHITSRVLSAGNMGSNGKLLC